MKVLAGTTGLEPAASCVTGMRSNQLNYVPPDIDSLTHRAIDSFARPVPSTAESARLISLLRGSINGSMNQSSNDPIPLVGGIRLERMTFCL